MKKSVEIIGLPVISILEGKTVGTVTNLVINAKQGSVSALAVDDGKWYHGVKLLPFASILGIGESAVTINNSNDIVTLSTAPEYEEMLEADIKIISTKVLTKSGRILGKVTELIVDESGKIASCEIEETSGQVNEVSGDCVCTFGKEVLIITDNNERVAKPSKPQVTTESTPAVNNLNIALEEVYQSEQPVEKSNTEGTTTEESSVKYDEKHRKYLIGKKATRRVQTDKGIVIVEQGGEITEEVLQKAKLAGKFVELTMNIE